MSLWSFPLAAVSLPLRFFRTRRPRRQPTGPPRMLVIRRNRLGDMLCTLPLLKMLRLHFPQAYLAVACDPPGEAVARSCDAVNEVIVLKSGWNRWQAAFKNARDLQDFDWVIAAKGGYDRRLAFLTRLTNAPLRIGFARGTTYFTDPVSLPKNAADEHQIETLLRLGTALSIRNPTFRTDWLRICLPENAVAFSREILAGQPFAGSPRFILVNLSSTVPVRVKPEDFMEIIRRLRSATHAVIGLVFAPHDLDKANQLAAALNDEGIVVVPTPGPLELAALLDRCTLFITPEGGAAHLAAAVNTPTVVLWSEGPLNKWKPRGARQTFAVVPAPKIKFLTLEQIWEKIEPHLASFGVR